MESFLSRDNVDMLIEILLDDKPTKTQSDINQIIQELNVFRNTNLNANSSNMTLLELNQTFLKRMVQGHSSPQQQQQQPQYQQQQQSQYQQQQLKYKVEDLKAERMDFFDQQLAQKRNEFEAAITLKKPTVPTFEDPRITEQPISDIDTLIAQRNLEIPFLSAKPSDWLSPANTSVRSEKQQTSVEYEQPTSKYEQPTSKYDNFDQSASKKITWSDDSDLTTSAMPSIFSKLKQTPSVESQIEALTSRIVYLENKVEQLLSK